MLSGVPNFNYIYWIKLQEMGARYDNLPSLELQLREIVLEMKRKEYLNMDTIVILKDMAHLHLR